MAFQREVGSGVNRAVDYHDLLSKIVAMATSQHVATVAVNAGGTAYVVGDVVTLTHAGAVLDARFEVTTVSAGVITGLRINDSGAFSIRLASAVIGAGGTGYAVGDFLELDTGTEREKAKVTVATLSGSAVATVTVFETGGAYSVAPSSPGATTAIGPSGAGAGTGCTLTPTMTALIGTTALAVTGGTGSSATVDITLAETGWTVDERNTNNRSYNSILNEKEVVLVGDATGKTNKPYIGFGTLSETSGINERYGIAIYGMITHNPATAMSAQVSIKGDAGTFTAGNPYLICDEDQNQEMDLWITANDSRIAGVIDINPAAASTDDSEYLHWHAGYITSLATESEDPYPMMIMGASRDVDVDPSSSSTTITGLSELQAPTSATAPAYFYRSEDSTWVNLRNSHGNNADVEEDHVIGPVGQLTLIAGTSDADAIVTTGPLSFYTGIGSTGRASPTRRLRPVPGTSDLHFPIPLTVLSRPGGSTINTTLDTARGQVQGIFWVYNTDDTGATISNFSDDYITISGDRYRVFHTHVHTQLYHYICIKEDV